METHELIERLFDALKSLEQQIGPLSGEIVKNYTEHLRQMFERKRNSVTELLEEMDQEIRDCIVYVVEYNRLRSILNTLNSTLVRLGQAPLPVPEPLPSDRLEEILIRRIELLRSQGKL